MTLTELEQTATEELKLPSYLFPQTVEEKEKSLRQAEEDIRQGRLYSQSQAMSILKAKMKQYVKTVLD